MNRRTVFGAAALATIGGGNRAARAQSGGSLLFVPNAPDTSAVPGRSIDRERNPLAWGIRDDQWMKFRDFALTAKAPLTLIVRLNNLRARQFKEDLTELLESIPGWDVEDQGTYTAGTLPPFEGILIQNISEIAPAPDAQFLKNALDAAGILPEARFDSTQPNHLRVVIGAPPP